MGTFTNRVRNNKIASPTTAKWSAEAWQQAFERCAPNDEADARLFAAGRWFARAFASHRSAAPELGTLGLSGDELTRAALASLNRNWIVANEQMRIPGNSGDTFISEKFMAKRIRVQPWDIEVDPNGLMEAAVDSLRHVVFASASPPAKRASVAEILSAMLNRSIVSSAYLSLETMWSDCLWNSWAVFEAPDYEVIRPTELRQAVAQAAAVFRGRTLSFSYMLDARREWKKLPVPMRRDLNNYRVVREVRGAGRGLEILTRTYRDDEVPGAHLFHMSAVEPWLDHFVLRELPAIAPISLDLLFRAWDFVRTLAEACEARMPKDTAVFDLAKLWSYAPSLEVGIVSKALASSLSVTPTVATAVLEILTITSARNADPWLTPLWRTKDRFFLIHPVAFTSNPQRLADHWLTIGGVDLGIRGPLFESFLRAMCLDGIEHSEVLRSGARCAANGIELNGGVGDMDLVCAIGNTVLVAECKTTTTPVSAVERANYSRILHEAAQQVRRKVAHAASHVDDLIAATGWALVNPTFLGVVVTDQVLGVGQLIEGVPVIDHVIFAKYFQNPIFEKGVTFSPDGSKTVRSATKFYRTLGEAEKGLAEYLMSPPQMELSLKHLVIHDVPLLTMPGAKPAIHSDFAVDIPETFTIDNPPP